MAKNQLLGPDGRPIDTRNLTQTFATPTIGGVRSVWHNSIARKLDPARLAKVLQEAAEGNNQEYLTLAEEMEERDAHYSSVLGQRKRAISLIDPIVATDGQTPEAVKEAVENLVAAPNFTDLVDDLLDGIAKGYAVVEPEWDVDGAIWKPRKYIRRDPRHYMFDRDTASELRIRDDAFPEGMPIPAFSSIVHKPRLKSGLAVRGGLARTISWCFMLKAFTLQDWAAFLEVFGMPLRVGKYDANAGPDEKRTLLRAVRDLGSDAAAIIPMGMEIEFIEAKGGQGNAVFGAMADYLDKQISKAVIGQTMTTDDGSSMAQANVHEDVKIDIKKADARQMSATINRDLIGPFVALNFGPDVKAPIFTLPVEDPEDVKTFAEALSKLVPMGFKVGQNEVRKRLGTAAPDDDDEILTPPAHITHSEREEGGDDQSERTTKRRAQKPNLKNQRAAQSACMHCGDIHVAAEEGGRKTDELDQFVNDALDHWQTDMQPLMEQILAAAEEAAGYDEFLGRLQQIDPHMDSVARRLAIETMKARGLGEATDISAHG